MIEKKKLDNIFIVTEHEEDRKPVFISCTMSELVNDWNDRCEFIPCNDAKVYFASVDGVPVNPYLYADFESLFQLLVERYYAEKSYIDVEPDVLPYLAKELVDDDTETGGTAFEGETVLDYLLEMGTPEPVNLKKLNESLIECGIRPIGGETEN